MNSHHPPLEPYDENRVSHQEPIRGVSEWQESNDVTGSDSTFWELYDQERESREPKLDS
jgi:hypothetical protein